ncbi:MAG: DUF3137 domain-containing protein [Actinomycetota bacterium]|nr:DUF3137 domain-containing protein [Actinomycetota bacterium]
MPTAYYIVPAIIILAIIGAAVYGRFAAKTRRGAIRSVAATMGFSYVAEDPAVLDQFAALGAPFDLGFDRRATNVLVGNWDGRPAIAWDYSYKTRSSGKNNSTVPHDLGIVCILTELVMPHLMVAPEWFLSRAIGKLANTDVLLESEDFNRAFTVISANARFASDVLHPRMMQFLLAHPEEGFTLRGEQALHMMPGHFKPDQLEPALTYLDEILDRIPQHLRRTLPSEGQG